MSVNISKATRGKNLILLGVIVLFAVVMYATTIIRMSMKAEEPKAHAPATTQSQ